MRGNPRNSLRTLGRRLAQNGGLCEGENERERERGVESRIEKIKRKDERIRVKEGG